MFSLLTAPREVPEDGALGGLLFDAAAVAAVYGKEVVGEQGVLPVRETLEAASLL